MPLRTAWFNLILLSAAGSLASAVAPMALAQTTVTSRVTLAAPGIGDQDDMCIWVHPSDRSQSTVITSDKGANKLFVYDLAGNTLQTLPTPGKPGNIDVRYGFLLAGHPIDIVVCNDRTNLTLLVYTVDPATRLLARVDTGSIGTGNNYGSCLYHSLRTGAYYAFTAATTGEIHQFQLSDQAGRVGGTLVRSWDIGTQTEACVCDDETGFAYFAEEQVGIWKIGAEPTDPASGALIAAVGDASGLTADVEGLAIYYAAGGNGYLIASSQGNSQFKVYGRPAPHSYVKTFTVTGVTATDGLDVTNVNLGPSLPSGIFAAHSDTRPAKTVEVCAYQDLGLSIDAAYWNPRNPAALGVSNPNASDLIRLASYPNPFRPSTRIRYELPRSEPVRLDILDFAGRMVAALVSGIQEPGVHELEWDGRDSRGRPVGDGLYFVSLEAAGEHRSWKMMRLR